MCNGKRVSEKVRRMANIGGFGGTGAFSKAIVPRLIRAALAA